MSTNGIAALSPDPVRRKCNLKTEVYSRVCGYHRPVSNWNEGKREEFKERKMFDVSKVKSKPGVVAAPPVLDMLDGVREERNVA